MVICGYKEKVMETIKKTIGKNHYKMERYTTVQELASVTRNRQVRSEWESSHNFNFEEKSNWYGASSFEEAYTLLNDGWQAPTEKMTKAIEKVAKQGTSARTVMYNDVVGFHPNVPLSILNVPTSMVNMKKVEHKNKVIHIVYDCGLSCRVNCDDAFKAGLNLFETVLNLEMSGYRVELDALQSFCVGKEYSLFCVNVKRANQPMNIKKMMFPICNPAFARVIGFDWQDKCEFTDFAYNRGYPYYAELDYGRAKKGDMSQLLNDNAYYITYSDASNGKEHLLDMIKNK